MKLSSLFRVTVVFLVAAGISVAALAHLYFLRSARQFESISALGMLPPELMRVASLEFDGFVADYLMMRTMTFIGKKMEDNAKLSKEEWEGVYRLLDRVTETDNRFWDPYLLAESMLTWDAGMFDQANTLLLKAAQHRSDDYRPYYFIGFNSFFFRKKYADAAKYVALAAKRPGAPAYFTGLAARLGLYGRQTDVAIAFLDEMLLETTDPGARKYMETRLAALKVIDTLEKKVQLYRAKNGVLPQTLQDLVTAGFIDEIPIDPYGGEFKILPNGRVYTTSELVEKQEQKTSN